MNQIKSQTPKYIDINEPTAADTVRNQGVISKAHLMSLANLLEDAVQNLANPHYMHICIFPSESSKTNIMNYLRVTLARKDIQIGFLHAKEKDELKDLHDHIFLIFDNTSKPVVQKIKDTLQHMLELKLIKYYYLNPTATGESRAITLNDLQPIFHHFGYAIKRRSKIPGKRCVSFRTITRPSKSRINTGHLSRSQEHFKYSIQVAVAYE